MEVYVPFVLLEYYLQGGRRDEKNILGGTGAPRPTERSSPASRRHPKIFIRKSIRLY